MRTNRELIEEYKTCTYNQWKSEFCRKIIKEDRPRKKIKAVDKYGQGRLVTVYAKANANDIQIYMTQYKYKTYYVHRLYTKEQISKLGLKRI